MGPAGHRRDHRLPRMIRSSPTLAGLPQASLMTGCSTAGMTLRHLSECFVQPRLELLEMQWHLTNRRRRRRRASGVDWPLALCAELIEDPFEIRRDEGVRPHIA